MKKTTLLIGLTSILGVGGLVGCTTIKHIQSSDPITTKQSLSMQAATSLSMLSKAPSSSMKMAKKDKDESVLTEAEKNDIKTILPTLDLMLSNSSSFDSVLERGEFKPVAADATIIYNTKEVISFLGNDGKQDSYTLFYNLEEEKPADPVAPETDTKPEDTTKPDAETAPADPAAPETDTKPADPVVKEDTNADVKKAKDTKDSEDDEKENEKAEETESKDDKKEDEKAESSEIEVESSIEGLAFLKEDTYYSFKSEVETESKENKKEEERNFKITTGDGSYILVEQEHEIKNNKQETEFAYTVVENGITVLDYSIEIENKKDQVSLEYEIGGKEYELTKEEVDGQTLYHVEYENEETDVEALITFKKETNEAGEVEYIVA